MENQIQPDHKVNFRINSLKKMIESCHAYGGAEKQTYNFNRYILPYETELGRSLFEKVYKEHLQNLKQNFEIRENVYTDNEGGMYNSLEPKV